MALDIDGVSVTDLVEHRFDDFVTEGGCISHVTGRMAFADRDHVRRDAILAELEAALKVQYEGGSFYANVFDSLTEGEFKHDLSALPVRRDDRVPS
jgi:hypothetical protein